MDVDDAFAGLVVDERSHLSELIGRRRREIENGNVVIFERAKRFRLAKLRGQIEHRGYPEMPRRSGFAISQHSANPYCRCDLVPRPGLTLIVEPGELLAEQAGSENQPGAPVQPPIGFTKNDRAPSEI